MKKLLQIFSCTTLTIIISCTNKQSTENTADDKTQLLALETKWLEAEFGLDSAYLSTIIDTTFLGISGSGVHGKEEEIIEMYNKISQRIKDSIFIDSFKLENEVVNLYGNTAIVSFVAHTHGKNKGEPTEKWTRFYDVWVKRDGKWMAVASQGTKVE